MDSIKYCCGITPSFRNVFARAIAGVNLPPRQLTYINDRYIAVVAKTEADYWRSAYAFKILTNIIIVGGVTITALISLREAIGGSGLSDPLFWITFVLSLATTIASKMLYSYSIDKKYLISRDFLVRLQGEGIRFIHCIGTYEALDCDARFAVFVQNVEELYSRSTENSSLLDFNDTIEIVDPDSDVGPLIRSRNGANTLRSDIVRSLSTLWSGDDDSPAYEPPV